MINLKNLLLTLTIIFTFSLVGCGSGEAKIDASSQESFQASLEKMAKNLSDEEAYELQQALVVLMFKNMDPGTMFLDAMTGGSRMYKDLDGLTAKELIEKAKKEAEN